jgi:D-alanine-D-alanine ligase
MKTIGVFCGGFSSEREVSVKSARTILKNLPDSFDAFLIDVSRDGWVVDYKGTKSNLDLNTLCFLHEDKQIALDYGLVYVHGDPGENGKLQAFLDMKGVPCINSGALASELSFDKWYCNQFLKGFGIQVAKSLFLEKPNEFTADDIVNQLGLPLFVKPSDSGSSYGISKVKTLGELVPAIQFAFKEGKTVIIESFLDGIEVTCGVYRKGKEVHALPLTELATENEFFDFKAKYLGESLEITPARIPDNIRNATHEIAKRIYRLMQLRSIARIDFMIVNNQPIVIEVNTTPGFTEASIVPKMLQEEGISLKEFWEGILKDEMNR